MSAELFKFDELRKIIDDHPDPDATLGCPRVVCRNAGCNIFPIAWLHHQMKEIFERGPEDEAKKAEGFLLETMRTTNKFRLMAYYALSFGRHIRRRLDPETVQGLKEFERAVDQSIIDHAKFMNSLHDQEKVYAAKETDKK